MRNIDPIFGKIDVVHPMYIHILFKGNRPEETSLPVYVLICLFVNLAFKHVRRCLNKQAQKKIVTIAQRVTIAGMDRMKY